MVQDRQLMRLPVKSQALRRTQLHSKTSSLALIFYGKSSFLAVLLTSIFSRRIPFDVSATGFGIEEPGVLTNAVFVSNINRRFFH